MNLLTFDRLDIEPRLHMLQALVTTPIVRSMFSAMVVDDVSIFLGDVRRFHESLVAGTPYLDLDEECYVALIDCIEQGEVDEKLRRSEHVDAGDAILVLPEGVDTASAYHHEIIFHAFNACHISGTWHANLKEYVTNVDDLRADMPALHALMQFHEQNMLREFTHVTVIRLLDMLRDPDLRMAMLGLKEVTYVVA